MLLAVEPMLDSGFAPGSSEVMLRFFALMLLILPLTGCERKYVEAVVLEKEHIAAKDPTPTPTEVPALATPEASVSPEPEPQELAKDESATPEPQPTELAPDEVDVNGVVMKKAARGTGRDPRAITDEQWIVTVRATDGHIFNIPADRARFAKLRAGDRVKVVEHVGKYTGTAWSADFD